MRGELKVKINNYRKVEAGLLRLGAKFSKELHVLDTYFNQPKGRVLKITEDDTGKFLVNLKSKGGGFEIVKQEKINNVDELRKELSNKFGVKCILKKRRRFFGFGDYSININLIEDLGEFLIVEGENLKKEIVTEKLKIKNPKFITVSFDELKKK